MAQKTDEGPTKATAEDLKVLTPEEVPETVECAISKRKIAGADARQVAYLKGKNRWVHKRFLGEVDAPEEDDDDLEDFDEYEEYGEYDDEDEMAAEAESADAEPPALPAE